MLAFFKLLECTVFSGGRQHLQVKLCENSIGNATCGTSCHILTIPHAKPEWDLSATTSTKKLEKLTYLEMTGFFLGCCWETEIRWP